MAGYERAVALALTPRVPTRPPEPVTVNSRHVLLGTVAASAGYVVVLLTIVSRVELPGWGYGMVAGAGMLLVVALLAVHRVVVWREIRAGYCRMDSMVVLLSRDPERRFPASRMRGAPWDLRGLWRLGDDGSPTREPVAGVLAAGHYPSPNRAGQLELWTGVAWAYRYRAPERPFL